MRCRRATRPISRPISRSISRPISRPISDHLMPRPVEGPRPLESMDEERAGGRRAREGACVPSHRAVWVARDVVHEAVE